MRDLEEEDSYDYGPNEMVNLRYRDPAKYDKIMSQNVGDKDQIDAFYKENLRRAKDYINQQREG